MTQNEIIEMAKQAGISYNPGSQHDHDHFRAYGDSLKAFAKLVADKAFKDGYEKGVAGFMQAVELEREACAKILDANAMACESPIWRSLLQSNAQAIRVRGQT
jgi:hypothetical protein